jgi:hypothetical protein
LSFEPQVLFLTHLCVGTDEVNEHYCVLPNNQGIHLIDTPGFDDSALSDTEILTKVADWFSTTYNNGVKMAGIVYLHRIIDARVPAAGVRNLRMFRKLVGNDSLANVVLATTFWGEIQANERLKANAREEQLKSSFWKDMIEHGSVVMRHDQEKQSGLEILMKIINRNRPVALDIQREMVDNHKTLDQTAAGQELATEIEKQRVVFEQRMEKMRKELAQSMSMQDAAHRESLRRLREKTEQQMQEHKRAAESLKVNREHLKEQVRQRYNEKIAQTESRLRAEERAERQEQESRNRARQRTQNSGYRRHPDCRNHPPEDQWHLQNCSHPLFA